MKKNIFIIAIAVLVSIAFYFLSVTFIFKIPSPTGGYEAITYQFGCGIAIIAGIVTVILLMVFDRSRNRKSQNQQATKNGVMALVNCPVCGKEMSNTTEKCPRCDYAVKSTLKGINTNKSDVITIVIAAVIIIIFVFTISSISRPNINMDVFDIKNSGSKTDTLTGDDLVAYNLMLEVCKVADDPTETFIISGTVTEGDTGGSIKVRSSGQISYVIVSYENGKAVCSDGREVANYSPAMMEMFTNTDDFDAAKVNQALKEHWGID